MERRGLIQKELDSSARFVWRFETTRLSSYSVDYASLFCCQVYRVLTRFVSFDPLLSLARGDSHRSIPIEISSPSLRYLAQESLQSQYLAPSSSPLFVWRPAIARTQESGWRSESCNLSLSEKSLWLLLRWFRTLLIAPLA